MATKLIDAGISTKHAKNWSIAEALRELVQNWLDVRQEFNCGGSISWKDGMATVKDMGPGMQLKHLAFGENDKAKGSIGQFGEGMKSAFIVLIRTGRRIEIRTNGMSIRPVVAVSEAFGIDTLHYEIAPMEARHAARLHGTIIHVECSEDELAAGKSYFVELVRQEKKGASKKAKKEGRTVSKSDLKVGFQWVEKGKISLPGGVIYVKGSAIGTLSEAHFSYHLDGTTAEQATNRDRDAVNMDVVGPMLKEMIQNTSSESVMKWVLTDMFSGNIQSWEAKQDLRIWSEKRARIWHRTWNENFGDKYLMSYNSNSDRQAEYRGYTVIYNLGWDTKRFLSDLGVKDTSQFQPKQKKVALQTVSIRDLTEEERTNFRWARTMVTKYYHEMGAVVIAEDLSNLSGTVGGVTTNGLYKRDNDRVYIRRGLLTDRKQTLHTLLHEEVHRVSHSSDETAEFERALLNVAVNLIADGKVK